MPSPAAAPSRSASRANTITVAACEPLVTNCLEPVRRPPAARVCRAAASDPDPGSVSANAHSSSPRASGGTSRCACSGLPWAAIGSAPAPICTARVTPRPASPREICSMTRT